MTDLHVLSALRVEAVAAGRRATVATTHRVGVGPDRAARFATSAKEAFGHAEPAAVVGLAGGLDPDLRPGDVVVAERVTTADGSIGIDLPGAALLAAALRNAGLRARTGVLASSRTAVSGARRAAVAEATGAIAVDMESAWLASELAGDRPFAVVRVVIDTPSQELLAPATLRNGPAALRTLSAVVPVLESWAAACAAERHVVLAGPRSFCAGVERAIEIVERALDRFGAPVYVRRQIVHNSHVVADLEAKGAVFVHEIAEVPDGSTVILAAHGVTPIVRDDADAKGLRVIDATCPLVGKVHAEARRFAERDYDIVLIGHAEHEEVEGTVGEAPGRITVVDSIAEIDALEVADPARVAYLTQTTLAVDEVAVLIDRLRSRFGEVAGPRTEDICYATQNRQEAVAAIAPDCDVVLVVGSPNSSNSRRLTEVAERHGTRSYLVDEPADVRLDWLAGARTVGVTAGASAPESKVRDLVDALGGLGPISVAERTVHTEDVTFPFPVEVR